MRSGSSLLSSDQVNSSLTYAVRLVHATCCLAGSADFLDEIGADLRRRGIVRAVQDHDTPALFHWLIELLSFQGLSDAVAAGYIAQHGTARWADIAEGLSQRPPCPKLAGYWAFDGCGYRKTVHTCAEPRYISACPLPRHPLRNGRLNQMAYGLFLFIRDVAGGDLVDWIDQQLQAANELSPGHFAALREAVVGPLRNVHGLSDKVLAMAISFLLFAGGKRRPLWAKTAASLVAVDTLVHNYLHRTGILRRFSADHAYGEACYRPGGCAGIIDLVAAHIDARQFNPRFPAAFPRFVQSAIWRYCAENGLDVCNGNRIDDSARCSNAQCQLFRRCDRVVLRSKATKRRFSAAA
jgi:hypothetical protein